MWCHIPEEQGHQCESN